MMCSGNLQVMDEELLFICMSLGLLTYSEIPCTYPNFQDSYFDIFLVILLIAQTFPVGEKIYFLLVGFTRPLTEMSTRSRIIMFLGSKAQQVRKADNLTAICKPMTNSL
jgi:hypothetical protein